MKMKLCLLLFAATLNAFAQKKKLVVGDEFDYKGSLTLRNGQEISVNKLRGKPVIIETFSSSCVVCFKMLPKMEQLQQDFDGKVEMLFVGYPDKNIEAMYSKFEKKLGLTLRVSIDSQFFKAYEFLAMPTYIWIDKLGKIAAVTHHTDITKENIDKLYAGQELGLVNVTEPYKYKIGKPYLVDGNGGADTNYLIRSVIGKWDPSLSYEVPSKLKFRKEEKCFNVIGTSLFYLYKYAWLGKGLWFYGDSLYGKVYPLVEIEGDSIRWENLSSDEQFCYSAAYRGTKEPNLERLLRDDLEAYFGYEFRTETRKMPYWSVEIADVEKVRAKTTKRSFQYSHTGIDASAISINDLLFLMDYYDDSFIPYIDETKIDYAVDVRIDAMLTDPEDFMRGLRDAGFKVTKRFRDMKVIVLKRQKDVAAR